MYITPKFYLDFILYNKSKILIFIKKNSNFFWIFKKTFLNL